MKEVIENGVYTCLNEKGETICIIESLGDNIYKAKNKSLQIISEIKFLDNGNKFMKCIENKNADKNGRFRKSNKLMVHNMQWLAYMLEEKGIIRN